MDDDAHQSKTIKEIYLSSNEASISHVDVYKQRRSTLSELYPSEAHTLRLLFGKFKSVLDVGCSAGNLYLVLRENDRDVFFTGIDLDPRAIEVAKTLHPDAKFFVADFLEQKVDQADLVIAFNVFDQYRDWKNVLEKLCALSSKFVNFSSLLRLDGETLLDDELSYTLYHDKRVLWAVHNVFSLIVFCATARIGAKKILIYCYNKPLATTLHGLHPKDLYVGNVILELDHECSLERTGLPPEVQIFVSGNLYYSNIKNEL